MHFKKAADSKPLVTLPSPPPVVLSWSRDLTIRGADNAATGLLGTHTALLWLNYSGLKYGSLQAGLAIFTLLHLIGIYCCKAVVSASSSQGKTCSVLPRTQNSPANKQMHSECEREEDSRTSAGAAHQKGRHIHGPVL